MSASLEITQIEILQQEVLILKDTILMLSHNIRCLNIRQGSQPVELPNVQAEFLNGYVFITEGPLDEVYIPVTPDEFENMVDILVINEDRRYQDEVAFGAGEIAWAK